MDFISEMFEDLFGKSDDDLFTEMYDNMFEADENNNDIPDLIEPAVKKLESKGYKVKYASPGHSNTKFDNDRNKDGVINSKFRSTARIIFERDYKFPNTPNGWEWRALHNGDKALYTKAFTYNYEDGKEKAFKEFQTRYMDGLNTWVEQLPPVGSHEKGAPDENF